MSQQTPTSPKTFFTANWTQSSIH